MAKPKVHRLLCWSLVFLMLSLGASCARKPKNAAYLSSDIESAIGKIDENAVQQFRVRDGRLDVTDVTSLAAKPPHTAAIVCNSPLSQPIPFARCVNAWFTANGNGCLKIWQDHGLGMWCAQNINC